MPRHVYYVISMMIIVMLIGSTSLVATPNLLKNDEFHITNIEFGVKAEGIEILYGENRAVAVTGGLVGSNVTVPFDLSDPAFNGMISLFLCVGNGTDWIRYIHKPIWGFPPGVMLTLGYRLSASLTETQAIQRAFEVKSIIEDAYNFTFQALYEEVKNNIMQIMFVAYISPEGYANFVENEFKTMLGDTGLMALIRSEKIIEAPVSRVLFALLQDEQDMDKDGNTNEFVPLLSTAFIVENAIEDFRTDEYLISVNNITGHDGQITWDNESIYSGISIKIPFPVFLNRELSTPTNSSFPDITGKYEYLLHARDINSGWEVNWTHPPEDIVIVYRPFDYETTAQNFPIISAEFTATPEPFGVGSYSELRFNLSVSNLGTTTAYNTLARIQLDNQSYHGLLSMLGIYFDKGDWDLVSEEIGGKTYYWLQADFGDIPGNSSATPKSFRFFNIDPESLIQAMGLLFYAPIGPVVTFSDNLNITHATLANGLVYPLTFNGSLVIARIGIETYSNKSYVTVDDVATVTVNITNYGGSSVENIHYQLLHGIINDRGELIHFEILEEDSVDYLAKMYGNTAGDYSIERNYTYIARTKPGMHVLALKMDFTEKVYNSASGETISLPVTDVFSNFLSIFILPPYRIRGNIFRYPLPRAKISVNKSLTFDNETNEFTVRLELTNEGDLNTTIIHIIDYWDMNLVSFVSGSVRINGSSFTYAASISNDKINVTYIIIGGESHPINISAGETIIVEYRLKVNEGVNGTINLVSNPALVFYDFGPYEMEREESPGGSVGSSGGEATTFKTLIFRPADQTSTNLIQEYSNLVLAVINVFQPEAPSGEEETTGGGGRLPTRFIVIAALGIIVVSGIVLILKRRE